MSFTARLLLLLAVIFCAAACRHATTALVEPAASAPDRNDSTPTAALTRSPRVIIGRIIAVDRERGFAFVDLATTAPAAASRSGAVLVTRKLDLRETGELRASSYQHARTLGAKIVSGQPAPGDEVVWSAPR